MTPIRRAVICLSLVLTPMVAGLKGAEMTPGSQAKLRSDSGWSVVCNDWGTLSEYVAAKDANARPALMRSKQCVETLSATRVRLVSRRSGSWQVEALEGDLSGRQFFVSEDVLEADASGSIQPTTPADSERVNRLLLQLMVGNRP